MAATSNLAGRCISHIGKIVMNMGVGNDQIAFNSLDLAGSVAISGGDGKTTVSFVGTQNKIVGDFKLVSGWGNDSVEALGANLSISGAVNLAFGPGKSRVALENTTSLNIGGPLTILGNGEDDVVRLGSPTGTVTLGPTTINGGSGNNLVSFQGNSNSINGHVKITTTNGADAVQVSSAIISGNLTVNVGNGDNEFFITDKSTRILGDCLLTYGAGIDSLQISALDFAVGGKMVVGFGTEMGVMNVTSKNLFSIGRSLTISGAGLNNKLSWASSTKVGEDLRIDVGGAETKISKSFSVGKNFVYNGKVGSDSFFLSGPAMSVGDQMTLNSGKGGVVLQMGASGLTVGGKFGVSADEGTNTIFFQSGTGTSTKSLEVKSLGNSTLSVGMMSTANLTATGDVMISSSTGADVISLSGQVKIGGKLAISTGAGRDSVQFWEGTLTSSLSVSGMVTVQTGAEADQLRLFNAQLGGPVTVDTGAGDDFLYIDDCTFFNTVSVSSGDGDDHALIESSGTGIKSVFQKGINFKLGAGTDLLSIAQPLDTDDFAEFLGGVSIDGGADIDRVGLLPLASGGSRYNVFNSSPVLVGVEAIE